MSKKITGFGAAIYDIVASVSDDFITGSVGDKGGMAYIDSSRLAQLVGQLPADAVKVAGGSAANTVFALAQLGLETSFVGKVGRDEFGRSYREQFLSVDGDCSSFKESLSEATAICLSMVTPDCERTMRTCLAAASTLTPEEITAEDLRGSDICHIEGYALFNRPLALHVLKLCKELGVEVSYDLGSFEVVSQNPDIAELLADYVDIVYANEDEARAFAPDSTPENALEKLATLCKVAVVKLGRAGSLIQSGSRRYKIAPLEVERAVDTTGAGDLWACGFLYGYANSLPLDKCGEYASLMGAEAVRQFGGKLSAEQWERIGRILNKTKKV
jgi:sugar/nucleoside kinase (ribokinase family)